MIGLNVSVGPPQTRPTPPVSPTGRVDQTRAPAGAGAPTAVAAATAPRSAAQTPAAPAASPVQPVAAIRNLQQAAPNASAGPSASANPAAGLTEEEKAVVEQLKARDREVRAHEQAHAAVGGQYASAPSYEYEVGPDGHRYAVGGEVRIDTSAVPDDPEATIEKMEIVKAAALAPAEPSAQDRKVAQLADQQRAQAQAQLFAERAEARAGGRDADEESAAGVEAAGGLADRGRQAEAERGYETSRAAQAAAQIVEIVAAA